MALIILLELDTILFLVFTNLEVSFIIIRPDIGSLTMMIKYADIFRKSFFLI